MAAHNDSWTPREVHFGSSAEFRASLLQLSGNFFAAPLGAIDLGPLDHRFSVAQAGLEFVEKSEQN